MSGRHIHFVVAPDGWVLERMARNYADVIEGATVGSHADLRADCNVYMPYYLMAYETKRDVALFTHLEDAATSDHAAAKAAKFHAVARAADACWAMSHATAKHLPPEKTQVLKPPPAPEFLGRPLVLGFSGIPQPFGRKNFEWIDHLRKIPGVECRWTMGKLEQKAMPGFYREIDYLVVLSNNEGGPMPVVEALACGTPVIAPDVGWAWDYPVLRYTSLQDLTAMIQRMTFTPHLWQNAGKALLYICRGDTAT